VVRVLLAFSDVGLGVQLQEALEGVGLDVRWDGSPGVVERARDVDAVILDGDELRDRLGERAAAWRALDPAPGLVAIGTRADAETHATRAHCAFVPTHAPASALAAAITEAERLRFAAGMTPGLARRALGLTTEAPDPLVMTAARSVDIAVPRAALAWHAHHYVAATAGVAALREARALTIPEVELTDVLDGTMCVQTLVKLGRLDAYATARLLWALASTGESGRQRRRVARMGGGRGGRGWRGGRGGRHRRRDRRYPRRVGRRYAGHRRRPEHAAGDEGDHGDGGDGDHRGDRESIARARHGG